MRQYAIRLLASLRQVRVSILLIVAVLISGTVGFYLLGASRGLFESLYLTVMIVTTVGLKEQYPAFNESEGVWSLVVMLTGIATVLWAAGNLVAFLIGGELARVLGRHQLLDKISKLTDHFIVCGYGRMGRALGEALRAKGVSFVIIEIDPAKIAMADALAYLYIEGDATLDATLKTARIDRARGLASCLKSDADNVLVTVTARSLHQTIPITARAEREETEHKLEMAGANRVICPPRLGATRIMQMMLHPGVEELMDVVVRGGDLEISKIRARDMPKAVGSTLQELKIPSLTGLTIVVVVGGDGSRKFNPPPHYRINEKDEMLVIGPPDGVEKLLSLMGS